MPNQVPPAQKERVVQIVSWYEVTGHVFRVVEWFLYIIAIKALAIKMGYPLLDLTANLLLLLVMFAVAAEGIIGPIWAYSVQLQRLPWWSRPMIAIAAGVFGWFYFFAAFRVLSETLVQLAKP